MGLTEGSPTSEPVQAGFSQILLKVPHARSGHINVFLYTYVRRHIYIHTYMYIRIYAEVGSL